MPSLSFAINTAKNERDYLKLLLDSMYANFARRDHEILVFVDSDNQGTAEFLVSQKSRFPKLRILRNTLPYPIGLVNMNIMFERATSDVVSYLHSDMVVGPRYDERVLTHLTEGMILSSTRIEPPLHPRSPEKITRDFGMLPSEFQLDEFSKFADAMREPNKLTDFHFAPYTCYKNVWLDIGGMDTIYRRSREDSDILWRMVLNGTSVKQTWDAIVYHFTCASSRGANWWQRNQEAETRQRIQQQADRVELMKFQRKWGTFKHPIAVDEAQHHRYRIAANCTNCFGTESVLVGMFSMFDKIYVDDPLTFRQLNQIFETVHDPANNLLGFTSSQWSEYQSKFRTLDFESIYAMPPIVHSHDIVVDLDMSKLLPDQQMQRTVSSLNDIVHHSLSEGDTGDFEVEGLTVHVNRVRNAILDNIYVAGKQVDVSVIEEL
jgi:GT2 family glycosyltransferase